jgi:hypothetical protein
MKSRSLLPFLFGLCFVQYGRALDYLQPGQEHRSPDAGWKVWVVKHSTDEDNTAEFHLSRVGDADSTVLCENARHFGAEWSPDSKTLLVYDNFGSGNSDVIVFRLTPDGWKRICQTNGGFHVIWRRAKWIPGGVQLHAQAGGSEADLPPDFTISFDNQQQKKSSK